MDASTKAQLLNRIRQSVADDLKDMTDSQRRTLVGATHEESRPENDKDTRALESSYLARGLAERVEQLQEAVARLEALAPRDFGPDDPVALSALVVLEDEAGSRRSYFLAPVAGGTTVSEAGQAVRVVTPSSPLGRAILGKRLDDDVEYRTPEGVRELTIVGLS